MDPGLDAIEDLACVDNYVLYSQRQEDSTIVTLHVPARYSGEGPACSETLPSDAGWARISISGARSWRQTKRKTERLGSINLCGKCRDRVEEWLEEREKARARKQDYERAQQLKKRVMMANLSCRPPERRDRPGN